MNVDVLQMNDLRRHSAKYLPEIERAVSRVLKSGYFIDGPENEQLEQELASYFGLESCALVGNGTDAIELALRSVGVRDGDSVVTVANAGGYASTAIRAIGARPIYCDIDRDSLQMCPRSLTEIVMKDRGLLSAVVVTHLYGKMAAVESIKRICEEAGLPIVEDCAQSIGAESDGRKAGVHGSVAAVSFYPTKNLGGIGDGGAVLSTSADLIQTAKKLRQYGWSAKYHQEILGGRNSRMDEINASVIRTKLHFLDELNQRRREIHGRYYEGLPPGVVKHEIGPDFVAHLSVIEIDNRDSVQSFLRQNKISSEVHYPVADYRQQAVKDSSRMVKLPVTESMSQRILSIPNFPEMTISETNLVVDQLLQII